MRTLWIALKSLCFMTGFVILAGWLALSVRGFDGYWTISLPEWSAPLGALLMTLGAVMALACVGTLVIRGHGTPAPFDAPSKFVAAGPYRFVRNPMYVGGLNVLLGLGLYLHSPSIVLFAAAWFGFAHLFVTLYEEPNLRPKFGQDYEEYLRTVPRWFPHVGRGPGYRATVTRAGSSS